MHGFACGPKTVLVKRTFLKNAISEVRLGWGGACQRSLYFVHYIVCYAAEISGIVATLLVTMLQGSLVLLLRDMILRCWWGGVGWGGHVNVPFTSYIIDYSLLCCRDLWNQIKKSIPSNLSAKSDLLMVYARAWQWRCIHKNAGCQLKTVHALQWWRWKGKKRASDFARFPTSEINSALWQNHPFWTKCAHRWARFPVRRDVFENLIWWLNKMMGKSCEWSEHAGNGSLQTPELLFLNLSSIYRARDGSSNFKMQPMVPWRRVHNQSRRTWSQINFHVHGSDDQTGGGGNPPQRWIGQAGGGKGQGGGPPFWPSSSSSASSPTSPSNAHLVSLFQGLAGLLERWCWCLCETHKWPGKLTCVSMCWLAWPMVMRCCKPWIGTSPWAHGIDWVDWDRHISIFPGRHRS